MIREAQREIVEETKAEYNPAAYGMNRAEEQVMQTYPAERYSDRPRYYFFQFLGYFSISFGNNYFIGPNLENAVALFVGSLQINFSF